MQELVTRLELASDTGEVVAAIMGQLLPILGLGVARWVSRLSRIFISLLAFSPPVFVFRMLYSITKMCPECLTALVKFVRQKSWRQESQTTKAAASLACICILELATFDFEAARLRGCDLENLPPVNRTFDTLVTELISVATSA